MASRGEVYGIPGIELDGNDVLAIRAAAGEAVSRARAGGGPTLFECKTYRTRAHAEGMGDFTYRTRARMWRIGRRSAPSTDFARPSFSTRVVQSWTPSTRKCSAKLKQRTAKPKRAVGPMASRPERTSTRSRAALPLHPRPASGSSRTRKQHSKRWARKWPRTRRYSFSVKDRRLPGWELQDDRRALRQVRPGASPRYAHLRARIRRPRLWGKAMTGTLVPGDRLHVRRLRPRRRGRDRQSDREDAVHE